MELSPLIVNDHRRNSDAEHAATAYGLPPITDSTIGVTNCARYIAIESSGITVAAAERPAR